MNAQPQPPQGPLPPAAQPPPLAAPQVQFAPVPPLAPPLAPGGVPAQPPLLNPPAAPTTTRNFLDYYNDPANDPYSGQYANIMAEYHVPVNNQNVQTPQALANRAFQSASQGTPISFIMLSVPANAAPGVFGQLVLLHQVANFYPVVGMPAHQWSDHAFAFKGDLVQGQLPSVDFDSTFLHQANGQLHVCPTADSLAVMLAGDPAVTMVGPFANGEAGTELVRTRRVMYVPPRYLSIFLCADLSPRVGYERLLAATTANNDNVTCEPLLQWMRLAMTMSAANTASMLAHAPPTVPLPDAQLIEHRWAIVTRLLPVLDPSQTQHGAQHIAASIGALADEQRIARNAETTRRLAERIKNPSSHFGTAVRSIMRLCQVATEQHLPTLYHDLARAPKRQEIGVVQAAIDDAATQFGVQSSLVVTPSLGKKVATLAWQMTNAEDLSTGLHPFVVGYKTPAERQDQLDLLAMHDMVMGNGTAPSLQDARIITSTDQVSLPLNVSGGRYTLLNMLLLCSATLGAAHPVTTELHRFVEEYERNEPQLEHIAPPPHIHRMHVPAYMVRWVQLRFSRWVDNQVMSATPIAAPRFADLFDQIFNCEPWAPPFPAAYFQAPPAPAAPSPALPPARAPAPALPYAPAPAPAQPPAQPVQPAQPAAPVDARVTNNHFNNIFEPFQAVVVRTRQVYNRCAAENVPLPRLADGRERCLAFHVKGMCNARCGRAYDHVTPPPADDQALCTWCGTHWHA